MSFRASYDVTTKVISAAVFVLFLVIAVQTKSIAAEAISAILFAAAYAWSPTGYAIADGFIVIRRVVGNVRIPVASIREMRAASTDDLRFSMRIFGSGGLFGYYGLFRNSKLGTSNWYVTNRKHAVVLVSDSGTAVISPDDVPGFIAAVGKPAMSGLPESGVAGRKFGWLTPVVLTVVAGLVAFGIFYAPGPPSYTLTKQSLEIHDRLYPVTLSAASVDVGNVRVIDFDQDADWKPVMKAGGFSGAHYHAGWFRTSSGQKVRVYRADSQRVVLLPPKGDGAPVLLETKDPEKFVGEVRQEWD
jgi:hypothetical protein